MPQGSMWRTSGWMIHAILAHVMCKVTKFGDTSMSSTKRAYQFLSGHPYPTNTRYRRRNEIVDERLPEFQPMALPGPQVPVPSMQRTQRPLSSGNTIPMGEGDVSYDLSQGAVADVPGGRPVVQTEDLRRRSKISDGSEDKRLAELSTVVEEPVLEISEWGAENQL
jgi:hypothetical protein